ncbi:MAG: hypothetical protein JXB05_24235 [Myxococcaceae bacterium]|nr:hypothetical protein [Myxococcaceae bacterium]
MSETSRVWRHDSKTTLVVSDTGGTTKLSSRAPLVGGSNIVAASTATQRTRIGWVYKIEGHLDGQPVQYVGSAADLKQRLTSKHQWTKLLQQEGTKVYALEVFADLDVQASNRRTLMSARNEALRAAEQRALDQMKEQVERTNQSKAPGAKGTRILNEINASTDAAAWEVRHKVATGKRWRLFERRAAGATAKAFVALSLLDAYLMYHDAKMSRYVMAPYVLEDEQGLFTLEKRESLLSSQYFKAYLADGARGQRVEVSPAEFRSLKEHAEALWGTTDWKGDFVPGLLNRELPVVREEDAMRQMY